MGFDGVAFREGFWLVVQIVCILGMGYTMVSMLHTPKTRQLGMWTLGIIIGLGLVVGLLKGFGVRIITGR